VFGTMASPSLSISVDWTGRNLIIVIKRVLNREYSNSELLIDSLIEHHMRPTHTQLTTWGANCLKKWGVPPV